MLKILAWIVGLVVVLIAGSLLYLRNADLNAYEKRIEGILSEAVGLEVDIDGRFQLQFGRVTSISAENISVSNSLIAGDSRLLRVGEFNASIRTWSLIARPIVVEQLRIAGADISLSKDAEGIGNWVTARAERAQKSGGSPQLDFIVFREVDVNDVQFRYFDPAKSKPVDASVKALVVNPDDTGMLALDLDGTIGGVELLADGRIGPLQNLLAGYDIDADLNVTLDRIRLRLNGSVADPGKLRGLQFAIDAQGPDIEQLIDAFALPPFADGAFAVSGNVGPRDAGNEVSVDGNIGSIELAASGNISDFLDPDQVAMDFRFSGPESAYIAELFGVDDATRAAFDVKGGFQKDRDRFEIFDLEVDLGQSRLSADGWVEPTGDLPDMDLTISGAGPNLAVFDPFIERDGIPAEPYEISGRIRKEAAAWSFDDVAVSVGQMSLTADGQIEGRANDENRIRFRATGPDLSALGEIAGIDRIPPRQFDISADLRGGPNGVRVEGASGIFGDNRVDVDGLLVLDGQLTGTDLSVRGRGPDLAQVPALAGIAGLPTGAFDLGGRIQVGRRQIQFRQFEGRACDFTASANGSVARQAAKPQFDFDLSLFGDDLAAAFPYQPLDRLPGENFNVSGTVSGVGSNLTVKAARITIGNLEVDLDASVDTDRLRSSEHMRIRAAAPDTVLIRKLTGIDYLPGGPFQLEGNLDSTDSSFVVKRSSIRIGEHGLSIDGEVGKARPFSGNDISLFAEGPTLREIGRIFGDEYMPPARYSLTAQFDGTETGVVMEAFDFSVAQSQISGRLSADVSGDKPRVTARFNAPYLDLSDRIPKMLEEREAARLKMNFDVLEHEDTSAPLAPTERFFSAAPLDLAWLDAVELDIAVTADRIQIPTDELTEFSAALTMQGGSLVVEPFSVSSPRGGVNGGFRLTRDRGVYSVNTTLKISDVRPPLLAAESLDPMTIPPTDVDFRLDGRGQSLHEIVGKSNGHLFIFTDAGQVAVFGSQFFSGGLIEGIGRAVIPVARPRMFTVVDCGIADIDIVDGVASLRQVAIQTDQLKIVASGSINLDSERLRLTVRTMPREGISVVSLAGMFNPFVRVAGTLKHPSLEIDPSSSAASAGAAVATAGLSVLARGLWDRMRGGSNMCRDIPRERPERSAGGSEQQP